MFYPRFQHIKLGVLPLEVGNFSPEMPSFYVDLPTVIMPISDECKKLFFTKGEVYLVRISIVVFLQLRLCPDCSSLNMSNAVVERVNMQFNDNFFIRALKYLVLHFESSAAI